MKFTFDWKEYAEVARRVGAEGSVLIKNDNNTLPVAKGAKVALYGRTQFDYIKSGSGSGGLVNTPYAVNVYEGLANSGLVELDEKIADTYREWLKENPFDRGVGWANEPFSQVEMPVDFETVKEEAGRNDVAVVVFGRLAGEDKDNVAEPGSYLLRADEEDLLSKVCKAYDRVAVVLNSGNIIDMKWVSKYNPGAVLYVWQGGMEGGNAVSDVITGKVNPSGHLADTIAFDIKDYPSTENFGDKFKNIYTEDIFVGYRYFETFAKDKVLYPFGYGLSYTTFSHEASVSFDEDVITVITKVTNTGKVAGKDAVQVYYEAPKGKISKPARELAGFTKTGIINPGESETVTVSFAMKDMASFDDAAYTGNYHAWVLEAGEYTIYEGEDVRLAVAAGSVSIPETFAVEKTEEALAPREAYERMVAGADGKVAWEAAPLRRESYIERSRAAAAELVEIPYAGSQKYNLKDVSDGKITLDEFIAGLSDSEMIQLTRGEGMCSARVTPGTAAAFGGVTDTLESYGIPAMCCADGPSGIRMDVGTKATQGPNGVCLACTFDKELVEELYTLVGKELRLNKIDSLLGPGMNIHRSPLNGRNFEYFSEDPYLTGIMAAYELKGMHKSKVTGTIKHFSCNNQEFGRHISDSVVSARALREIYLKGYEIAVKEGGAYMIMSTYGVLNGTHTPANYDQNGAVLRKDWGYTGLVETDWWTFMCEEDGEASRKNTAWMMPGQNDIYMVTTNAEKNDNSDNMEDGLKNGIYSRAELQRAARSILSVALRTLAFDRLCGITDEWEVLNGPVEEKPEKLVEMSVSVENETVIDETMLNLSKGAMNVITVKFETRGRFMLHMDVAAEGAEAAQIPMVLSLNKVPKKVITKVGSDHEYTHEEFDLEAGINISTNLVITFRQDGIKLKNMKIVREDMFFPFMM